MTRLRSGCARSTGYRTSPEVVKVEQQSRRHQEGTTRPATRPHEVTRAGTATSRNRAAGYRSARGVRIDTEALSRTGRQRQPQEVPDTNPVQVGADPPRHRVASDGTEQHIRSTERASAWWVALREQPQLCAFGTQLERQAAAGDLERRHLDLVHHDARLRRVDACPPRLDRVP